MNSLFFSLSRIKWKTKIPILKLKELELSWIVFIKILKSNLINNNYKRITFFKENLKEQLAGIGINNYKIKFLKENLKEKFEGKLY